MKKIFIALFCCVALVGYGQECISGDCENGQGTMIYANGDKYVGEWKKGKSNGQGTYTSATGPNDGDKYEGEWKGGKPNGQGTYTYANSDKITFVDGTKYVGEWKNGKPNGQGTYNYGVGPNDGDKYVGEWKDGSKHGQGSYTYANGDNYVGKFSNDKKWGQGFMVNNDGRILYSGIWVDDHPYE